jgi:predicted TIM-barrel fold metal-dependent hydrolase
VKVWKDLGLSVRDASGALVGLDDPRLADVWDSAAELDLPVLVHVADPRAFWQPVDRTNERFEELALHPEWSYAGRPVPSHAELVAALERVAARHRRTTFIAAHLASCAEDLAQVGRILDEHPNVCVDLSAREAELGRQPRAARAFLLRYADRVLWGADTLPFDPARYRTWFRLLESADEYFPYSPEPVPPQGRWAVSGLDLPPDVLAAVYAGNARRVIPALQR